MRKILIALFALMFAFSAAGSIGCKVKVKKGKGKHGRHSKGGNKAVCDDFAKSWDKCGSELSRKERQRAYEFCKSHKQFAKQYDKCIKHDDCNKWRECVQEKAGKAGWTVTF
jgi:hypothetical protein